MSAELIDTSTGEVCAGCGTSPPQGAATALYLEPGKPPLLFCETPPAGQVPCVLWMEPRDPPGRTDSVWCGTAWCTRAAAPDSGYCPVCDRESDAA